MITLQPEQRGVTLAPRSASNACAQKGCGHCMVSTNPSIQESLYLDLSCFGCGPANPHGLHIQSY